MPERILLVEDDLRIRKSLASFLRIEGYEVNEASNGQEVIEVLQKDEIDLVLSDVVMPDLMGLIFYGMFDRLHQRFRYFSCRDISLILTKS